MSRAQTPSGSAQTLLMCGAGMCPLHASNFAREQRESSDMYRRKLQPQQHIQQWDLRVLGIKGQVGTLLSNPL